MESFTILATADAGNVPANQDEATCGILDAAGPVEGPPTAVHIVRAIEELWKRLFDQEASFHARALSFFRAHIIMCRVYQAAQAPPAPPSASASTSLDLPSVMAKLEMLQKKHDEMNNEIQAMKARRG